MRDLLVRVDDQQEHNLQFGRSVEIEVKAGIHEITATNRLFSAKETVTLKEDESATYMATNQAGGCFAALMLVSGSGAYKAKLERLD